MPSGRLVPAARSAVRLALAFSALAVVACPARAQLPQTRLFSVFPPGVKAGTPTLDVLVANGTDLDELDQMVFNHPGLKAAPKMADVGGKPTPVLNTFVVSADATVPPGIYEVRVHGLYGLSNPRTFVVGDRDEVQEVEPNNTVETATPLDLNKIVNARSNSATDVDWYKFNATKGQRILAESVASRIDSRMSPVIELYGPNGRRMALARSQVRGDSLLDVTIPSDGTYLLKVYDFVYGGSADHFYRLSLGTGPFIDYVFPPSGVAGSTGSYTLYGRNLPGGAPAGLTVEGHPLEKLTVQIPLPADVTTFSPGQNLQPVEAGNDGVFYQFKGPTGSSNPVIIRFASGPVVAEIEPNDVGAKSQKVAVPAEVVGQFQARGDVDFFSFDAKAGEAYILEAFGERDGTPADPYLTLDRVTKNDKGEETLGRITAVDDDATNLLVNVFDTKTDDVIFRFQVPADGEYRISIRDRYFESRGDPRLVYRLSIRKEAPDYRLVALPLMPGSTPATGVQSWAMGLRRGDTSSFTVLAFRRDGFNGPIDVSIEGLPAGVTARGATIGPNQNSTQLTLTAAENAAPWSGTVKIVGKASIEDPEKVKAAAAARATIKPLADNVPKLETAATKTADDLKKATEAFAKAKEAADKDAANKALQDAAAAAQKVVDTTTAANKTAQDALAAGKNALAAAEAATKAADDAVKTTAKEAVRPARSGTIVWNGAQNVPGVARVGQSMELSVLKEAAPYQVTIAPESFRIEASQGRTILVPVKLIKRNGFDNNVTLTFEGLPQNTNIAVENKPINKGKDDELLKVTIAPNAVVGTYNILLRSQGQVAYVRNPEKLELAKKEQEAATKAVAETAEALKKANADKDAATKKMTEDAEAVKKAVAVKTEAEKKNAAAVEAVKKATEAKDTADKGTDEAAKAAAAKALTDAQAAAKTAADELAAAVKAQTDLEAAAKLSAEAKTKADAAAVEADTKSKAAVAAKTAADAAATAAANVSKPNNINFAAPSESLIIDVRQAPLTLAPNVPGGGAVKRGAKLEVKVAVNRINGFTGPVTLDLAVPPGVVGLKAAQVAVPADQKEGTLVIEAGADATEGPLANVTIRAAADFNGKASVDAVIPVKVDK